MCGGVGEQGIQKTEALRQKFTGQVRHGELARSSDTVLDPDTDGPFPNLVHFPTTAAIVWAPFVSPHPMYTYV